MTTSPPSAPGRAWDVILTDGSTARVRPISPADVPGITALHGRLSKETVRLRYFGAHPHLSDGELARLVEEEGPDHLALVAELGSQLVGVAQYDRIPGGDVAEVAFVVDDAHQGLGIGTLLLEYLASEGRRYGLRRFAADTLFENARMVSVFRAAGFTQHSQLEDGVIRVVMDISHTTEAPDRSLTSDGMEGESPYLPGPRRPLSAFGFRTGLGASRVDSRFGAP